MTPSKTACFKGTLRSPRLPEWFCQLCKNHSDVPEFTVFLGFTEQLRRLQVREICPDWRLCPGCWGHQQTLSLAALWNEANTPARSHVQRFIIRVEGEVVRCTSLSLLLLCWRDHGVVAGWWFIRFKRVNYHHLFCSCRRNDQNLLHSGSLIQASVDEARHYERRTLYSLLSITPPSMSGLKSVYQNQSCFKSFLLRVFLAPHCINIKMNLLYSYAMLQFKLLLNGGCAPRVKVLLWFIDVWLWIHQLMPPWCKCITLNAAGVSRCLIEMDKNKKTKWQ